MSSIFSIFIEKCKKSSSPSIYRNPIYISIKVQKDMEDCRISDTEQANSYSSYFDNVSSCNTSAVIFLSQCFLNMLPNQAFAARLV